MLMEQPSTQEGWRRRKNGPVALQNDNNGQQHFPSPYLLAGHLSFNNVPPFPKTEGQPSLNRSTEVKPATRKKVKRLSPSPLMIHTSREGLLPSPPLVLTCQTARCAGDRPPGSAGWCSSQSVCLSPECRQCPRWEGTAQSGLT